MSFMPIFFRSLLKAVPALAIAVAPGFREAYRKSPQKALAFGAIATGLIASATVYGYHHYERAQMGTVPEEVHTGGSNAVKPHHPN